MRRTITLCMSFIVGFGISGCTGDDENENYAPTAEITSHDGESEVWEQSNLQAYGTALDINDDYTDLLVTWYRDDTVVCLPSRPDNDEGLTGCNIDVGSEESVTITLEVEDPGGLVTSTSLTMDVGRNDAPTASVSSPVDGNDYSQGTMITFSGNVSDTEDPPHQLVAWWTLAVEEDEEIVDEPILDLNMGTMPDFQGIVSTTYAGLPSGEHELTLHAGDSLGREGNDTVTITILNVDPTCFLIAPGEGETFAPGEEVLFEGTVTDPVDVLEAIMVTWSSDLDGELDVTFPDEDSVVVLATSELSEAEHQITMRAEDMDGGSCEVVRTVIIAEAPDVDVGSPEENDVFSTADDVFF